MCVLKDGAYLVRDSVRQLDGQPFTLMVFYQDKVYNIQIRQQNQQFLLGTGLKVQEVNLTSNLHLRFWMFQKLVKCLKPLLNSLLLCVSVCSLSPPSETSFTITPSFLSSSLMPRKEAPPIRTSVFSLTRLDI